MTSPHLHEQHRYFLAHGRIQSLKMFSSHSGGKLAAVPGRCVMGSHSFHFYILSELTYHTQC